jgi:hypothetical protein
MKGPADSAIRIGGPFSTLNPEQSLSEKPASIYFHNVRNLCRPTSLTWSVSNLTCLRLCRVRQAMFVVRTRRIPRPPPDPPINTPFAL